MYITMLFVIPFNTQVQSNKHDLILSFVRQFLILVMGMFVFK